MMRVKSRLFKFGEKNVRGEFITEDIFRKALESPQLKEELKGKVLLGSISHKKRDDAYSDESSDVPIGDWMMAEGSVALALTDLWIDEDEKACYCYMDIFDTEEGKMAQTLLAQGVNLLPSIVIQVVDLGEDNPELRVRKVLGVDLTTSPAFNSTLEVVA